MNCIYLGMILYACIRFWLKSCNSGKFSKTAGRAVHSRQAAHGLMFKFLDFWRCAWRYWL